MTDLSTKTTHLESIHGLILSLVSALFAELCLAQLGEPSLNAAAVGRVAILFVSLLIVLRFSSSNFVGFLSSRRDTLLLLATILVSIVIIWVGRVIAFSIAAYSRSVGTMPDLDPTSFFIALPFASGALVLQSVVGYRYCFALGAALAIVAALYLPMQSVLVPFVFSSCFVACISLSRSHTRSAYLKAGFRIGLFSVAIALASLFLEKDAQASEFFIRPILGLVGGVMCAFIASGITPVVENVGGYVTDLRLIEMATLDHPLLKDLSVKAPGTWNHSMVMGMMAEAAAEAVEANSVVARVGAYFHDIGKSSKPLYFVENQFGEENRHDKLSPSMSALIIRSHVKEGIELAKQHNLPRVIIDMIPQHHGTSVIEYFYDKASKEAEQSGEEVDRNLYTYPGPKPQTKEAGILMLADGVEASARTLTEPTLDRIQGLVQKMINKVFASGELDECELTLKDLHEIAKSFTRVLHSIHHQRIAYAEPMEKGLERDEAEKPEEVTKAETEASGQSSERKPKKEDLKRLGL